MKYFQKIWTIFLSVALCSTSIAQVHTITFTGKDWTNQYHIPLHHVTVFNLDQLWEEVLYYPDTTLVLGTVGVDSYNVQDVQLMQNVPNPFDGITEFALVLPEGGDVQMEIYDIAGRLAVGRHFSDLQAGTHLFQTTLASPQTYLLSAKVEGGQMTIKMVNEGHGAGNTIQHLGMTNLQGDFTLYLKNDKYSGGYPFSVGDEMKYTGYALIDGGMKESNIIQCHQNNNDTYTLQFDVTAPTVTTASANSITSYSAVCGGNVTVSGGSPVVARGVCWSTSHNPTLSNSHVENGTGLGSFTCSITGLTTGTTYYVRAYATNGVGTAYGSEKSFTTLSLPTVTTNTVTGITGVTATSGGNVTSDGGGYVTARGVCWSTSQNPTVSGGHTTNGNGIGSFTSNITGLSTGTTYYVRAYATNSVGTAYGEQRTFTTATLPTVTTNTVSSVTNQSATCGGNVTFGGYADVIARGICWSTSQNPTINNSHTYDGTGTGAFSSVITGLTANTTYYVRAYATNSAGTAYGSQRSFTTLNLPIVMTNTVSNISTTTATCGGNVTSAGSATVTSRGVCWGTSSNPTVSDSHTTNGSGTGNFTSSITGLTAGTTYYVRAYATSSVGTAYGTQRSFTTTAGIPTVVTSTISDVLPFSATCGGNVTSSGGSTVTARGVCWSTSQNPTVSGSHTTNGNGIGSFTSNITGLSPGTTYYVRAYATNNVGTGYGDALLFTTSSATCPGTPTVTDCDGNIYNTVYIGDQCWMKENLRVTHYEDGSNIVLGTDTASMIGCRYYPGNDSSNVALYGYLYNWKAVMNNSTSSSSNPSGVQGLCPTGWHVPSDPEWTQLTSYVKSQGQYICGDNSNNIAKSLASNAGWEYSPAVCAVGLEPSNSNNATGFSAYPASDYDGIYYQIGSAADFWSCTQKDDTRAFNRRLVAFSGMVFDSFFNKYIGFSVRCLKDTVPQPCPNAPTVTDYDGNVYRTIQIGNQCWMRENLRTTHYANGDSIMYGDTSVSSTTAYYYNYSSSPIPFVERGYLYNWSAVMHGASSSSANPSGIQGICPTGWHVPSYAEWIRLADYVGTQSACQCNGDSNNIAKALSSTTYWSNHPYTCTVGNTTNSNNTTGFSAIPAGEYHIDFGYSYSGGLTHFWSATADTYGDARCPYLNCGSTGIEWTAFGNSWGYSVRCVYDVNYLPEVSTASVTSVSNNSAMSGGNVLSAGSAPVTARGVCWSTSQNPTVSGNHTINGNGIGSFTSNITGLSPGTTYYVRAYATSSAGTAYGTQRSFTTITTVPSVSTNSVSDLTYTTAICGGNVNATGGDQVTARGVCWSTSQNPTIDDNHTIDGIGSGSFTSNITGLAPDTTYYIRAYATNSVGTGYGNEISFTTLEVACPGTPTVTDYDGNIYNTVHIGNQCWLKENLRVTHYSDGTEIPLGDTISLNIAYRYYPLDDTIIVPQYGYLYNRTAVMNGANSSSANPSGVQGVCPVGWHVPSYAEWKQLKSYVGNQSQYACGGDSNYIAKSLASTSGWSSGGNNICDVGNDQSANNATGFSAYPTGLGGGTNYSHCAYFWSTTLEPFPDIFTWPIMIWHNGHSLDSWALGVKVHFAVRCVKN